MDQDSTGDDDQWSEEDGRSFAQETPKPDAKYPEPQRQETSSGQIPEKEVGGRPSPWDAGNLEAPMRNESRRASAAAQSTPFFVGTSHKELRALLHARDSSDAWAAMLEQEHPAQDWCEAYRALQQNKDPKLAVLLTLIYYQNEQWLKARQVSGLASKIMFASCREQYDEIRPPRQDALFDMPHGMSWPKLAICSANNDALDHNFALTVMRELCADHNTFATLMCCAFFSETKRSKDRKVFWKSCSTAQT